jgi:hypothetical protein
MIQRVTDFFESKFRTEGHWVGDCPENKAKFC